MILNYLLAILSVILISLVSLLGVFTLSLREDFLKKYIFFFISLAVGALLGDAFIHLIPESFEHFSNPLFAAALVLTGMIGFFLLEKYLHWHHHMDEEGGKPHVHPIGQLILFSDAIHNMVDGLIIGASFIVSIPVGIATTIAVVLHEIPQEVGDFSVLLHAGYEKKRALWLNFASALTAVFGLVIALAAGRGGEAFIGWLLPLAAGGFIYIAVADLIPELRKNKQAHHTILQGAGMLAGVLAMVALLYIE